MLAKSIPLGIYESAPAGECWLERLKLAKALGFDFVEMSLDETDARLARLDWSPSSVWRWSRRWLKPASGCRRCALAPIAVFRWVVKTTRCGIRGWKLCVKLFSWRRMWGFG